MVLVLLCWKLSITYWFLPENITSNLLTLVSKNKAFLSLVPIYIIFPRYKELYHITLSDLSIFNSLGLINSLLVILPRISFIIGKRIVFSFGKSFFLPLIINTIQDMLKVSRLKWLSIWYYLNKKNSLILSLA